jgi:hypothetical protein
MMRLPGLVLVSAVNERPDNLDGTVARRADSAAVIFGRLVSSNPFRLARMGDNALTVTTTN